MSASIIRLLLIIALPILLTALIILIWLPEHRYPFGAIGLFIPTTEKESMRIGGAAIEREVTGNESYVERRTEEWYKNPFFILAIMFFGLLCFYLLVMIIGKILEIKGRPKGKPEV